MGSSLLKDTLREIKGSLGRFFSIMMIVAIGVAFFAGVKASVPDMKYTADQYYDDYHMMDLRVVSTFGLTQADVDAIRNVEGIEGVFATHTKDVITYLDSTQLVLRIHALPQDQSDQNKDYINRVQVIEGRLPQQSGECVIQMGQMHQLPIAVGDTIRLESGNAERLSDSLRHEEYTVVGKVLTPYYLSNEIGSSEIGSGKVNYYIMVLQDEFKSDIYTEANITIKNARELNSYDDEYFAVSDPIKNALENIAVERSDIRFAQIKESAQKELAAHEKEFEEGKKTFETEINANELKLDQAKSELILGRAELNAQKQRYADRFADYKVQIAEGKEQLAAAKISYEEGAATFETTKKSLLSQIDQLDQRLNQVLDQIAKNDEEIKQCEEQLKDPDLTDLERTLLEEKLATLKRTKQIAEETIPYIEPAKQALQLQLEQAEQQLKETKAYIEEQEVTLAQKEQELAEGEQKAKAEFAVAERKLADGQTEYTQGKIQFELAKASGQQDLDIAAEKLEKARADLEESVPPQWYVLDRHSHYSYMDYGSVADRMDGIAKVFPLFFFLVAALVCLTTMTRMVDEQRGIIGTMKALGYGKNAIAFKFIFYALIASVVGCVIGCAAGMKIFPSVIFNAWNLMYTLPSIQFVPQPALALTASGIVSGITVFAAFLAVYKELVETPALLMRPKAPKAGKKILLERIPWIWNHCSFTQKVTARNLFRYKKRFLMTVIGISGCTALLVAGYGIQDSISTVVNKQYGEILKYDVAANIKDGTTTKELQTFMDELEKDERLKDVMYLTMNQGSAYANGEESSVTIVAPTDTEQFKQFISLHHRVSHEELTLSGDGVLISEKLSMNTGLHSGDMMEISESDGIKRQVKVSGVVENYVGHYVYMSPSYYNEIFHIRPLDTAVVATMKDPGSSAETSLGNEWMEKDFITSVSFYSGIASSFADTISSLSFIVVVLVIAAGMLAFVVLYNLTNVNISERLREIATIKVLGFYDLEVAEYVYRENILLTVIGSLCGLILGIGLHRLIMNLAEMENVMFGRNIDASSFVISFAITLLFGLIVNLVMYRKLKKIPMVESLKSVE